MRQQNIILFSSGVSEKNGILNYIKEALEQQRYRCCYWRELFQGAKDLKNIALLPMLIKKIPTFDFAILICEGHDETEMIREGTIIHAQTMRDNVLFEIGLCTMALGLNRVILLTDGVVRLPEDLRGAGGDSAIKVIPYAQKKEGSYQEATAQMLHYLEEISCRLQEPDVISRLIEDIDQHILHNLNHLYPTVIGASVSTANGYMSNFILRTLEKCDKGFLLEEAPGTRVFFPDDKIFIHIILPQEYSPETPSKSREKMQALSRGSVPDARFRSAEFRYRLIGDELHIFDYPTTLVTGYQTARIILAIDADDSNDTDAERRFNAKELDLFENALRSFMSERFIRATVEHFYEDDSKSNEEQMIVRLVNMIRHIEITREAY